MRVKRSVAGIVSPIFGLRTWLFAVSLLLVFLIYYGLVANRLHAVLTVDTYANDAAIEYLLKHKRLPVVTAEDEEIMFTSLGTTRSTRPPLSYIVGAVMAGLLEKQIESRTVRQRLGGALLGALTVSVSFLGLLVIFKHLGVAFVGSVMIALLPQFTLLASSNNDDIGAIFSLSVLFVAALAIKQYQHKLWPWLVAALGIGLVLQAKFTAWLCLPIFLIYFTIYAKGVSDKLIRYSPILLSIVVIAGGWWILFNITHYGFSDPTALKHAAELQREIKGFVPVARGFDSMGISVLAMLTNFDGFLTTSFKSTIGYLPWIKLETGGLAYGFYGLVFAIGLFGLFTRCVLRRNQSRSLLDITIVLLLITQVSFFIHHNWARDVQPHGRYILPIILPMIYSFLVELNKLVSRPERARWPHVDFVDERVILLVLLMITITAHMQAMRHYLSV